MSHRHRHFDGQLEQECASQQRHKHRWRQENMIRIQTWTSRAQVHTYVICIRKLTATTLFYCDVNWQFVRTCGDAEYLAAWV